MDTQKIQTENQTTPVAVATTSCRKYAKDDNATYLENMKGHFNGFVNSSMDEHKACLKNTMDKIFGRSKTVEEKKVEAKEVESHASLQAANSA